MQNKTKATKKKKTLKILKFKYRVIKMKYNLCLVNNSATAEMGAANTSPEKHPTSI